MRDRPLRAQRGGAVAGPGTLPPDPGCRAAGPSRPPRGGRSRGRTGPAPQGERIHRVPAGPQLLSLRGRSRGIGVRRRRGDGARSPGRGDRHQFRARPRRGHQPGRDGHRRPRPLGRSRDRGASGRRLLPRHALRGDPPRGEAFPRPRPLRGGFPRGTPRRPEPRGHDRRPGPPPLPGGHPGGNPGPHDRARPLPGARRLLPRHALGDDRPGAAAPRPAVPGNGLHRRPRDAGDRGPVRDRRGRRPGRRGGMRRRPDLPGGSPPGGSRRGAGAGASRQPRLPPGGARR